MEVTKILLCCLYMATCFKMPEKNKEAMIHSDKQIVSFDDDQGSLSDEEYEFFKKTLNDASLYYRLDYENSLSYTSDRMENRYGNNTIKYSLFVQQTQVFQSFYFTGVYHASAGKGVDKIFPNSSYWLYGNEKKKGQYERNFISIPGQIGQGIDNNKKIIIDNVIQGSETGSTCDCNSKLQIANKIGQFDGNWWNIFCSKEADLHGVVWTKESMYYYAVGKCYYFLWAIYY